MPFYDRRRGIGRAVIDYQDLESMVRLAAHAVERGIYRIGRVEGRDYDSNHVVLLCHPTPHRSHASAPARTHPVLPSSEGSSGLTSPLVSAAAAHFFEH